MTRISALGAPGQMVDDGQSVASGDARQEPPDTASAPGSPPIIGNGTSTPRGTTPPASAQRQDVDEQNRILEMFAQGASMEQMLPLLARSVESHSDNGLKASILLLDRDGVHLRHGAAPSLPDAYNAAIDGLEIGPNVGSCGTAAFTGAPVVVSDIASDPRWADYRDLALAHGLRACWSSPILSPAKELGTQAGNSREWNKETWTLIATSRLG